MHLEAASVGEALRALAVAGLGLGAEVLGADGGPTAGDLVAIDGRDFTAMRPRRSPTATFSC